MLPLLRRFWAGEIVDHEGDAFRYEGAVVRPLPLQKPLDIWLGGIAPSELRRCGRLGDGWLPSFCTPEDVRDGIVAIQGHAAEAGREIEAEHFGALIPYTDGPIPDVVAAAVAQRRPGVEPERMIASGLDGLRTMIGEHIEVGRVEVRRDPAGGARRLGRPPRRGRRRPAPAADLSTVGRRLRGGCAA